MCNHIVATAGSVFNGHAYICSGPQLMLALAMLPTQAQQAAEQQQAEATPPGQQIRRRPRPKRYSASDVVAMHAPTEPAPGPHTL